MYRAGLFIGLFLYSSIVSVTSFKNFRKKALVSEAKIQLAAVHAAQDAFFSENKIYAGCFEFMGYNPEAQKPHRYYAIGVKSFEIDSKYLSALNAQKESSDLTKNCFDSPKLFFDNGKFKSEWIKITPEMLPDDAKVVIDEDGGSFFKVYAMAMNEQGMKSLVSIDQDKNIVIHDDSLITGSNLSKIFQKLRDFFGLAAILSFVGILVAWVLRKFNISRWIEIPVILSLPIILSANSKTVLVDNLILVCCYFLIYFLRQTAGRWDEKERRES